MRSRTRSACMLGPILTAAPPVRSPAPTAARLATDATSSPIAPPTGATISSLPSAASMPSPTSAALPPTATTPHTPTATMPPPADATESRFRPSLSAPKESTP